MQGRFKTGLRDGKESRTVPEAEKISVISPPLSTRLSLLLSGPLVTAGRLLGSNYVSPQHSPSPWGSLDCPIPAHTHYTYFCQLQTCVENDLSCPHKPKRL